MVAITPGKGWLANGKCDGAAWSNASRATREFPLGIDGCLKLTEIAVDEVLKARPEIRGAERFHSFLVSAKRAIVPDVGIVTAIAERMPAMHRAEVLIGLHNVLRTDNGTRIS